MIAQSFCKNLCQNFRFTKFSVTSFYLSLTITFHFLWLLNLCLLFPSFQMWFITFRTYEVRLRAQSILSKKIKENKFVFATHLKLHFQYTVEPWIPGLMRTGLKSPNNRVQIFKNIDNKNYEYYWAKNNKIWISLKRYVLILCKSTF